MPKINTNDMLHKTSQTISHTRKYSRDSWWCESGTQGLFSTEQGFCERQEGVKAGIVLSARTHQVMTEQLRDQQAAAAMDRGAGAAELPHMLHTVSPPRLANHSFCANISHVPMTTKSALLGITYKVMHGCCNLPVQYSILIAHSFGNES
jgi:hypothetical protein